MRKLILLPLVAALAVPAWAVAASPNGTNAAKQCKTERAGMGADAFKQLYGTNASKSNAFGKCVSSKVKHTP